MRSQGHTLFVAMALPTIVMGALLAGVIVVSGSGKGLIAEAPEQGGGELIALDLIGEEGEEMEEMNDEEPGYGYVEALPDDAPETLTAEEKAEAMEEAAVAARLGAGWEEGELLSEDLRIFVSSVRSQLEMYADELGRLEADEQGRLEQLRSTHAEAESRLGELETVGEALRSSMLELQQSFERLAEEAEAAGR